MLEYYSIDIVKTITQVIQQKNLENIIITIRGII
jgi:hypothetical protein